MTTRRTTPTKPTKIHYDAIFEDGKSVRCVIEHPSQLAEVLQQQAERGEIRELKRLHHLEESENDQNG